MKRSACADGCAISATLRTASRKGLEEVAAHVHEAADADRQRGTACRGLRRPRPNGAAATACCLDERSLRPTRRPINALSPTTPNSSWASINRREHPIAVRMVSRPVVRGFHGGGVLEVEVRTGVALARERVGVEGGLVSVVCHTPVNTGAPTSRASASTAEGASRRRSCTKCSGNTTRSTRPLGISARSAASSYSPRSGAR